MTFLGQIPWLQVYLWGAGIVFVLFSVPAFFGPITEDKEKLQNGTLERIDIFIWAVSVPKNKTIAMIACFTVEIVSALIFSLLASVCWPLLVVLVIVLVAIFQ